MTDILDPAFNHLVLHMASKINWIPVAGYTASFDQLFMDWAQTGRIRINTDYSENTIFGFPSVNWAFRAWHDYCHLIMSADFTLLGERIAAEEQIRQMYAFNGFNAQSRCFDRIIDCEVNGQAEYFFRTGTFPVNQIQFARERLGI